MICALLKYQIDVIKQKMYKIIENILLITNKILYTMQNLWLNVV